MYLKISVDRSRTSLIPSHRWMQFVPSLPVSLRKHPGKMNSIRSVLLWVSDDSHLHRCWLNSRTTSSEAGIFLWISFSPGTPQRLCVRESSGRASLSFCRSPGWRNSCFRDGSQGLGRGAVDLLKWWMRVKKKKLISYPLRGDPWDTFSRVA